MNNHIPQKIILATTTDPVHIGTGGYSIGSVDNTIVRDGITHIPKIPATSLAGSWRYFMALQLQSYIKTEFRANRRTYLKTHPDENNRTDLFLENSPEWATAYANNIYASIYCAGQDTIPNSDQKNNETIDAHQHCGKCIVCRSFGYAKKNSAQQGFLSFTDLHILFFPVYTYEGTRWITSESILKNAQKSMGNIIPFTTKKCRSVLKEDQINPHTNIINLGNLFVNFKDKAIHCIDIDALSQEYNTLSLKQNDIIVVPDEYISKIINANLEVRTSVSIDPLTNTAKEGALFTTEAIPRCTVLYGNMYTHASDNQEEQKIADALDDSKIYYNALGIGGMTTRGFGRMNVEIIPHDPDSQEVPNNAQHNE